MHKNATDVAHHQHEGYPMKDAKLKETAVVARRILQERSAMAQCVNEVESNNVRYHEDDWEELCGLPDLLLRRICHQVRH